jgi:hypothetical protein
MDPAFRIDDDEALAANYWRQARMPFNVTDQRRFLIHVLPDRFHRIRYYGLFANGGGAANIARARQLLNVPAPQNAPRDADSTGDGGPQGTLASLSLLRRPDDHH